METSPSALVPVMRQRAPERVAQVDGAVGGHEEMERGRGRGRGQGLGQQLRRIVLGDDGRGRPSSRAPDRVAAIRERVLMDFLDGVTGRLRPAKGGYPNSCRTPARPPWTRQSVAGFAAAPTGGRGAPASWLRIPLP